jgi:hypothetical protein
MMVGTKALRAGVVACVCTVLCATASAGRATQPDFAGERASADARQVAQWAFESRDTKGRPFAIVDKKDARLFVFHADGRLAGASPALLGLAPGDHAVPGLGNREHGDIRPSERTTPAGRFVSEPGANLSGEHVIWIDYEEGLAIHRLRPAPASQRRAQRLDSATPADNRISLGCVIVPVAFYDSVVRTTLGGRRGVVYVLPETRSARELFGADPG